MRKIYNFIITSLFLMLSTVAMAQISGQNCIVPNETIYEYSVTLPGNLSLDTTNAYVTTWGGIEVVSVDKTNNKVYIKSKQGTTKEEYFSKFGKGRIWVNYNNGGCGYWTSFDVSKSFDMKDKNQYGYTIMSPACISAGDTITVAVTPIVTMAFPHSPMERYKWSFPDSLQREILFASVDSSSITFVAGEIGVMETISVKLGQCNFANPNNLLTRKVYKAPPKPIIVGSECITNGEQAIYKLDQNSTSQIATYNWYVNATKIKEGVSGDYQFDINHDNDFIASKYTGKLVIRVEANPIAGNCLGSLVDTIVVLKGFSNNVSEIAEVNGKTCFNTGEQGILEIIGRLNSDVIWSLPNNTGTKDTITNGNLLMQFNVPTNINSLKKNITAYVKNANCTDTIRYTFNIKPANVDSVSGARTIFTDSVYTYTVHQTSTPMPTAYIWEIPDGLEKISETGNSITVRAKSEMGNLIPFTVTAVGDKGCNADAKNIVIGYEPTPIDTIVMDRSCLNINMVTENVKFSTNNIKGHSFIWTFPAGLISTNDTTFTTLSNYVMCNVLGNTGNYNVTCKSQSGNNISNHTETLNINIVDDYSFHSVFFPGYFKGCSLKKGTSFEILNQNNTNLVLKYRDTIVSNFQYTFTSLGSAEYSGANVPLEIGYKLEIIYKSDNGCKVYKEEIGQVDPSSINTNPSNNFESKGNNNQKGALIFDDKLFDLYPNPTDNFVNISMKQYDSSINTDVEIYNVNGKIVYKGKIKDSDTQINISQLKSATYMMLIKTNSALKMAKFIKN